MEEWLKGERGEARGNLQGRGGLPTHFYIGREWSREISRK